MTFFKFDIPDDEKEVSEAILKLRDTLQNRYYHLKEIEGLTQDDLADQMGYTGDNKRSRVSKILAVETNLTLDTLVKIAHHLKMRFHFEKPEYYERCTNNMKRVEISPIKRPATVGGTMETSAGSVGVRFVLAGTANG